MKIYLVGKRIYLRGLVSQDVTEASPYFMWLNDLRLDLYTNRSDFPNSIKSLQLYVEKSQSSRDLLLLGIFDKSSDRHIGNITLQEFDWINRRAFMGYLLGDLEYARKGYATEAVQMIMYHGFNRLNLERIHTTISERNIGSLKVAQKSGLRKEGCLRKHLLRDGRWSDLLVFGALRDEWRAELGKDSEALFQNDSPAEI